jgi:hypothetical protein
MARKRLAIFEIEFVLAALLRRAGGDDAFGLGIAENGGAELFIDQDARLILWHTGVKGRFESLIDDPLGTGDLGGLCFAQRRPPTEQSGLERPAVVEGQNVERTVISTRHQAVPLSLR